MTHRQEWHPSTPLTDKFVPRRNPGAKPCIYFTHSNVVRRRSKTSSSSSTREEAISRHQYNNNKHFSPQRTRRYFTTLLLLFSCFAILVPPVVAQCPEKCECKWKGGKSAVECRGAGMTAVPLGSDPDTQYLDMSDNNIEILPGDTFLEANLLNLQKLYLSYCNIRQIENDALRRLVNLVELDLTGNLLTAIPNKSLREAFNLRRLVLSGNPLQRLEDESFLGLPLLSTLELSQCYLETVSPRAFHGLIKLSILKLDGNRLQNIKAGVGMYLRSLHGIHIHENPWRCDCELYPFRQWMIKNKIPDSVPPTCNSPARLQGLRWDQVDLEEMACVPDVKLEPSSEIRVEEQENVTLNCQIRGEPTPRVEWLWQGLALANMSQTFVTSQKGNILNITTASTNESDPNRLKMTSVLMLIAMDASSGGVFTCLGENAAGVASANVSITVLPREGVAEVQGLSATTIPGLAIALGVSALVTSLVAAIVVWRVVRHRRIKERQKRAKSSQKYLNSIGDHTEVQDLRFVGANSFTKTPKFGLYREVSSTELENCVKPLLSNSLVGIWSRKDTPCDDDKIVSDISQELELSFRGSSSSTLKKSAPSFLGEFELSRDSSILSNIKRDISIESETFFYKSEGRGKDLMSAAATATAADDNSWCVLHTAAAGRVEPSYNNSSNILNYNNPSGSTSSRNNNNKPTSGSSSSNPPGILFHFHSYPSLNQDNPLMWNKGSLISPPCLHKPFDPSLTSKRIATLPRRGEAFSQFSDVINV